MATVKFKTVEEYLSALPDTTRKMLEEVREIIRGEAPEAEEGISYNIPAFKQDGPLIYFAAWKEHVSLYPVPAGNDVFKREIEPYREGKGTIKFPVGNELPVDLIKKTVQYRMVENMEAALAKKEKKRKK